MLEKQRYFDRIVSSVSTLEGQLKFYLNTQEEIMLKYDLDINTKLNATIEDLKVTYFRSSHSEVFLKRYGASLQVNTHVEVRFQ